MGSAYVRDTSWLSWKTLNRYETKELWECVQEGVAQESDLSTDEERTKRLFSESMARWSKGVEDDNPRNFDNF